VQEHAKFCFEDSRVGIIALVATSLRREKLSQSTKFSLASPAVPVIVSNMAKHDPDLSLLFHALADPTRRSILTRLAERPARVTDLARPTGLRLPTVMRHLSVLEEAGLIATSKDGRIRTCAIVAVALDPVRTWLDEQRAIWDARLDRLDAFVMNVMKEREE
jgi:DNA-binding transcriptional ArsR family regulator